MKRWTVSLLRSSRWMGHARAAHEAAEADVLIEPELPACDGLPRSDRQAVIDAGEHEARRRLAMLFGPGPP